MVEYRILGTRLLVTDYAELGRQCLAWARDQKCVAMDFANTQIVTMRRHEPPFRTMTNRYDCFPPDGMPLIWCLNFAGAKMKDRVYGPTFMRLFCESCPSGFTHYLLGGSEECGRRLTKLFVTKNPNFKVVGSYHGRCSADGVLAGADDARVLEEIHRLSPDFIWVGFGTPKQQAWVEKHKHLLRRGVVLTVGFAFDVNAGMKEDAPLWMQKLGITWLFRLWSEPRRLGPRYLKYNFLFLWYLVVDGLRGKAWSKGV